MITTKDQRRLALDQPQQFAPGTNWSYAHSDYVILGLALEKITGQPLNVALRRKVLRPLGLRNTVASQTTAIPQPVLHAFSGERRQFLGIPASTPFLEESTFWNPSWTLARRRGGGDRHRRHDPHRDRHRLRPPAVAALLPPADRPAPRLRASAGGLRALPHAQPPVRLGLGAVRNGS